MKALLQSVQLEIKHVEETPLPIQIPVVYGGDFGPDLASLLKYYKMDFDKFVKLHTNSNFSYQ